MAQKNGVGDCSLDSKTTQTCIGTISTPKNKVDCNALASLAVRYPEYIEDSKSCPADCSTPVCGDGKIE
jgi:hypothetical protein